MNARAAAARVRTQLEDAGVPDAAFEAELLVREAAGLSRAEFFAGAPLDCNAHEVLAGMTRRRLSREPWAYVSGTREFYGLDFVVGPGVLVPRPETELLVEFALNELRRMPTALVADVGTGSGCVATAIAANAPHARIVATEASRAALPFARRNFAAHRASVSLIRGNLTAALARADVVVANLPYIPSATVTRLEPEVREWEPRIALDGGADGLDLVRRVIEDCAARLHPRLLALEVMAGQAGDVVQFAQDCGASATTERDLAGIERVVVARWE